MCIPVPCNDPKILRSDFTWKTRALLKKSEFSERCALIKYFVDNEFFFDGSIERYIKCKIGSTFEFVYASIIYEVRIISIANMKNGYDCRQLTNNWRL